MFAFTDANQIYSIVSYAGLVREYIVLMTQVLMCRIFDSGYLTLLVPSVTETVSIQVIFDSHLAIKTESHLLACLKVRTTIR